MDTAAEKINLANKDIYVSHQNNTEVFHPFVPYIIIAGNLCSFRKYRFTQIKESHSLVPV